MAETRLQVTQRKIRNGLRKQKEAHEAKIQAEKDLMWKKLTTVKPAPLNFDIERVQITPKVHRRLHSQHVSDMAMDISVSEEWQKQLIKQLTAEINEEAIRSITRTFRPRSK